MFGRGDFVCTLSRWDCEEGPALRSEGLTCHCTRDAGALAIISLETSAKLHEGHTEALSDRNMMGELRCNWITLVAQKRFSLERTFKKRISTLNAKGKKHPPPSRQQRFLSPSPPPNAQNTHNLTKCLPLPSPARRTFPPNQSPNQPSTNTSSSPLFTPLNILLLTLLTTLLYIRLRPRPAATYPPATRPVVFKTFTPATLSPYNGHNNTPVYIAIRGRVFDVTPGRNFYGPGGPYENFAGRDASRGLALGRFDEDVFAGVGADGELDGLEDLGSEEVEVLRGWEERFGEKYVVVGKLVGGGDGSALAKE